MVSHSDELEGQRGSLFFCCALIRDNGARFVCSSQVVGLRAVGYLSELASLDMLSRPPPDLGL